MNDIAEHTQAGEADPARRFGGLDRLYGPGALARLQASHVLVAGIGGVGSWAAEALARSGIGALTLVDLDHVAESNVNRQVHALSSSLGQSKIEAMADRIRGINPACRLTLVDDFVEPGNVAALLATHPDAVLDCTDQVAAKIAMALESRRLGLHFLMCGGAGGKTDPLALRAGDLSRANHDALLAKIRNKLRREHCYPRAAVVAGKAPRRIPNMGVQVLWLEQQAVLPSAWMQADGLACEVAPAAGAETAPQGLSCAGYGSAVMVTAAMGMAASSQLVQRLLAKKPA
ncbi:tRNA A37 threonylcarbamoyladenosine dehydratase [Kerstersia gyiorum]|uniref:tRNA threonylcarbamoyladenosine dehydratase n=1 Tax=Kerstersia gyiorum TaxID=206506 RepID=UPI00209F4F15|nr:tRNA threonylcarbamoyladenosine dehydratase [Kerstersia gyiorum]MCP1637346.1 tRNA A37 threonylcarbamoyladenosine dehydratase [Kerstersia gyiorum]